MRIVVKKGRYVELHENVPGKRGKKRFVRDLGILGQIDWGALCAGNEYGIDWHALELKALEEVKQKEEADRAMRAAQAAAFKAATGLELPVGPVDPVPTEKVPSSQHGLADARDAMSFELDESQPAEHEESEGDAGEGAEAKDSTVKCSPI